MTLSFVTRAMVLTCLTVAGWLWLVRHWQPAEEEMAACLVNEVIDAQTVLLACDGEDEEVTARLSGLDMPRLQNPRCEAERAHAALAADRLRALLREGEARLYRTGAAEEGAPLPLRIELDGADVARRLVRERLAAEAAEGGTDWCARLDIGRK